MWLCSPFLRPKQVVKYLNKFNLSSGKLMGTSFVAEICYLYLVKPHKTATFYRTMSKC